jgi:hypothetical protein
MARYLPSSQVAILDTAEQIGGWVATVQIAGDDRVVVCYGLSALHRKGLLERVDSQSVNSSIPSYREQTKYLYRITDAGRAELGRYKSGSVATFDVNSYNVECEHCGCAITVNRAAMEGARRHFCSHACRANAGRRWPVRESGSSFSSYVRDNASIVLDYLLARRLVDEGTGCWNWTGTLYPNGYGYTKFCGTQSKPHLLSAYLYLGHTSESGLFVCHHCDNKRCFNPDHLFIGTTQDNMNDMVAKDRSRFGNNHPNAVLDDQTVLRIREMDMRYGDVSRLAREIGVSTRAVRLARRGITWRRAADAGGEQ